MRRCLVLLALVGCSKTAAEPETRPTSSSAAPASTLVPAPIAVKPLAPAVALPLTWSDPGTWKRIAPTSVMRRVEYSVPHAAGDAEDADCAVFMFGAGQGGGVDANVDRWVRQFDPVTSGPNKQSRQIGDLPVTWVEVAGTYHEMQMPGSPPPAARAGTSRLVAAIVQAQSGSWFFKMTGPDATVKAHAAEFDALIDSLRSLQSDSGASPG